ncbi:MAG: hypothetical protein HWE20_07015 [Gammaproteobacteria bacterium]|nr:hypothetical protein [Gammaproteobacteria bacterium]
MKKINELTQKLIPKAHATQSSVDGLLAVTLSKQWALKIDEAWISKQTLHLCSDDKRALMKLHHQQRQLIFGAQAMLPGVARIKCTHKPIKARAKPVEVLRESPPEKLLQAAANGVNHERLARVLADLAVVRPPK